MRSFAICVLAGLLTLFTALPLAAKILLHADYARSEPAMNEVLSAPPAQVKVWFTQEVFRREGENFLHVTGPDGARVEVGEATVDDDDRTLLTVALAEGLPEGAYRVEWRALSAEDGHPKEGEFGFSVGAQSAPPAATVAPQSADTPEPAAEPAASPVPVVPTAPDPPAESGGLPCLGATPLALLAVGAVLIRRRKQSE